MTADQAWGVVRTILAFAGGYAVSKGYVTADNLTTILGGLGTLFVAGWSIFSKKTA